MGRAGGHGDTGGSSTHVQPPIVQDAGVTGARTRLCRAAVHAYSTARAPQAGRRLTHACVRAGLCVRGRVAGVPVVQSLARKVAHARSLRVDATAEALQGAKALKVRGGVAPADGDA